MQAYEFPDLVWLSQDLQGIVAWVLEADVVVSWGPFHKLEKNGNFAVVKLGVIM